LDENAPTPKPSKASLVAKEFNDDVLSGVYNGARYRKNISKIQEILTKMEELPGLYNDTYEMVKSLEEVMTLHALIGTLVNDVKQAEEQIRQDDIDVTKIKQILVSLQADHFNIEPVSAPDKKMVLSVLIEKFFDDADAYVKGAEVIRKKLMKQLDEAAG
jgi:hypothetical protein